MERMRILCVTPYYTPEGGGLERYAHAILSRLARRGHQVEAVSFSNEHDGPMEMDGVQVQRMRPRVRLGNTPIDPALHPRLCSTINDMRPDLVWAHTPVPFSAEMAGRAARRMGVPFVLTYHAGRLRGSSPLLSMFAAMDRATMERRMIRQADQVMAVTPFVRDHALATEKGRVHLVPPGVDSDLFCPPTQNPGGKDILFVAPLARSYRWKGIDTLLAAFRRVQTDHPDATLHLVGTGDRTQEIEAHAHKHGLDLRLHGSLSDAALAQAYQQATVVVLPSITEAESFGMVLAEANACGRPVIGSRIGGIPDFVRPADNGLLVRPGDASDLAQRLDWLLCHPEAADAMGKRGRERVVKEHDWEHLALRCEGILAEMVGADLPNGIRRAPAQFHVA